MLNRRRKSSATASEQTSKERKNISLLIRERNEFEGTPRRGRGNSDTQPKPLFPC